MIQAPRGTKDFYGEGTAALQKIEEVMRGICKSFGIEEIRTPIFEHTELFQRGVGETTDIVQKEMYTFLDKGGRSITLRPEGTAGAARAYIEHKMYADTQPVKLYYILPNFRYEKPQAGRVRQHTQFGIEMFGSYQAASDAEVISVAYTLIEKLGLKKINLHINSLGGPECRKKYNETLKRFIGESLDKLCPVCKERFEKNPLRVLDCKSDGCKEVVQNAPSSLELLDKECRGHFDELCGLLDGMGIPYIIDTKLVRGLDYYTRTVFEFKSGDIGAQDTICAGGRYDGLITELDGPATGAAGFGLGLERLLLVLEAQGLISSGNTKRDIYIGHIGERGFLKSQITVLELRKNNIIAEGDTLKRSVKAQMKYADKIDAKFSCIIGDDEIDCDMVKIKNMETGEQTEVKLSGILEYLKENAK